MNWAFVCELTGKHRIVFYEFYSPEWVCSRFHPLCLDRFINSVYLGDVAEVLGSSQSAFLISRPCSLLLRHSVNVGYFLFYFIQRSLVIQYPYPWVGNASFLYCEKLVSVWHSEWEYTRTLRCCDTWMEGGKKRESADRRVKRAKIPGSQASPGLTSCVSCWAMPFLMGSAKKYRSSLPVRALLEKWVPSELLS